MCNIRLNIPTQGSLEVYNILGERIVSTKTTSRQNEYSIETSDFQPGIYLVSLHTEGRRFSKKLVVLG